MKKTIFLMLLVFLAVNVSTVKVHAEQKGFVIAKGEEEILDWMDKKGDELEDVEDQVGVVGSSVTSLVRLFGNIVGFVTLSIFGIRMWTSGGNSTVRRELKDKALVYVIAAFVYFGAVWIFPLLYKLIQAFNTKG